MSYFQLIRREMHGSLPKLAIMSGLGGISNASILAAINAGMQASGNNQKPGLWAASLFLIALLLFMKTQQYVTITATAEIEAIIHKIRTRLIDQIRRSELLDVENIGRSRIVAVIGGDTALLTQASNMLCFTVQGAVLIIFIGLYVAYLSLIAFGMTFIIVGAAATIFHLKNRRLSAQKVEAAARERLLFDRLMDFLAGFKEVRLNGARSADLFDDAITVSRTAANIKIKTQAETFRMTVSSQISMYVLIGAVVFAAPHLNESLAGPAIAKTTTALLFIVGACFGLVQSIPILFNANAAADRIDQLERDIRAIVASGPTTEVASPRHFGKIELRNVIFRYVDKLSDKNFQIGPLDFDLRSGELYFIAGGNGSGKSTFLRVLAGLYRPDSGEITLDGIRVNHGTLDTYRALMSAIFFDYHLFQRLYGIHDQDPAELIRLLRQFRLDDRTSLSDGEFETLDLSSGQCRRLALIVALLEKRPILLLDEWTAEQDPEFRRKFYEELVPEILRAGITLVVITHDDRYLDEFHLPAHRLRMDEGRFVREHSVDGR
jgi:putative ATP-binding cassette transporter